MVGSKRPTKKELDEKLRNFARFVVDNRLEVQFNSALVSARVRREVMAKFHFTAAQYEFYYAILDKRVAWWPKGLVEHALPMRNAEHSGELLSRMIAAFVKGKDVSAVK